MPVAGPWPNVLARAVSRRRLGPAVHGFNFEDGRRLLAPAPVT